MPPALALAAALSLCLAGLAQAQSAPQSPAQPSAVPPASRATQRAVVRACAADMKTLCAGVMPGGGRILQCMRDNAAKLSTGCQDAVVKARGDQAQ